MEETPERTPQFASLIFHSLAARYAAVLRDAERLTGKHSGGWPLSAAAV